MSIAELISDSWKYHPFDSTSNYLTLRIIFTSEAALLIPFQFKLNWLYFVPSILSFHLIFTLIFHISWSSHQFPFQDWYWQTLELTKPPTEDIIITSSECCFWYAFHLHQVVESSSWPSEPHFHFDPILLHLLFHFTSQAKPGKPTRPPFINIIISW